MNSNVAKTWLQKSIVVDSLPRLIQFAYTFLPLNIKWIGFSPSYAVPTELSPENVFAFLYRIPSRVVGLVYIVNIDGAEPHL